MDTTREMTLDSHCAVCLMPPSRCICLEASKPLPTLTFTLLPGCERYAEDIKTFVDAMIWKLHKHRNKGHWANIAPTEAYQKLVGEVRELADAMRTGNAFHMIEECADCSNYSLILASALVRDVARGMQEGHENVAGERGEPVQWVDGTE